jgi:uncharacterized membrane protein YphA (DoxX/SURF4 family)
MAYRAFKHQPSKSSERVLSALEGVFGILLILGLFVQGVALLVAIDMLVRLIGKMKSKSFLSDGVNYYLILFVLSISLLVTGAGFLAFDLPL